MRIVICEDEVIIAEHLKSILNNFGYSIAGLAHNYKDSIRLIDSVRPDLAILDIQMQGHSDGIEIARYISKYYDFPFVFLTASTDKATIDHALSLKPFGYIVKPFNAIEIYSTIQIAFQKYRGEKNENYLVVKEGLNEVKIYESQIKWIKSDNIYIEIATVHQTYTLRKSLEGIANQLSKKFLMKCHRSYIINMNFIDQLQGNNVLIQGKLIPVSRQFKKEIHDTFRNLPYN